MFRTHIGATDLCHLYCLYDDDDEDDNDDNEMMRVITMMMQKRRVKPLSNLLEKN